MSNETKTTLHNSADLLSVGELLSLEEAAKQSGLAAASLRRFAGSGRLRARKMGRDWFTTLAAIEDYKESRHRGRKLPS